MLEELTIRSAGANAEIKLSEPEPKDPVRRVEEILVTLIVEGLIASTRIDFDRRGMEFWQFFDDLAASRKGWTGKKVWSAPQGDLALSAIHGGLDHAKITLQLHSYLHGWTAHGEIVIDVNQLEKIAEGVRLVLRT